MEPEVKPEDAYKYRVLVVLHDKKSRVWDAPHVYDSVDAAKRYFASLAKYTDPRGNPPLCVQYPDDFELWMVAIYDWTVGKVIPTNQFVVNLSDVLSSL